MHRSHHNLSSECHHQHDHKLDKSILDFLHWSANKIKMKIGSAVAELLFKLKLSAMKKNSIPGDTGHAN